MDVGSTLNTHFGHLGTAEIKKCRNHTSEVRIWHYNTSFYHFLPFLWNFKLQKRISAKIILQTKSFRCVKSFKMIQRIVFYRLETHFGQLKAGRSLFVRTKKVKFWAFFDHGVRHFGPLRPNSNYIDPIVRGSCKASKTLPDNILQHMNICHSFWYRYLRKS